MESEDTIPRLPALTDRTMVSFREGTFDVLEGMAKERGYKKLGEYIRGLVEREMQAMRPEDFARLRGVA